MTEEFDDYSDAEGVAGWISRDPFFRICILVEVIVWTLLALVACCCVCVSRRICRRGVARGKYSPSMMKADVSEMKRKDSSSKANDIQSAGVVELDFAPSSSSARSTCLKTLCCTLAIAIVVGFALMVALLAIFIPVLMPNALYMPVDCEGDQFCPRVPGTDNFFVMTESGNNVSIRLFPAHPSGKYFAKRSR